MSCTPPQRCSTVWRLVRSVRGHCRSGFARHGDRMISPALSTCSCGCFAEEEAVQRLLYPNVHVGGRGIYIVPEIPVRADATEFHYPDTPRSHKANIGNQRENRNISIPCIKKIKRLFPKTPRPARGGETGARCRSINFA